MDECKFSDKKQQLEAISRVRRSLAAFEKSLEEKCFDCIVEKAKTLQDSSVTKQQFACLSPLLRRDVLKKLESLGDNKQFEFLEARTNEAFERIFSLVILLLNDSITEFSFQVFEDWFKRRKETFCVLAERCPSLTSVEDRHRRDPRTSISLVLPDLLRLKCLEHIKLYHYVFIHEEFEQLVETFPKLRSLAITITREDVDEATLEILLSLQSLEFLWIYTHYTKETSLKSYIADEKVLERILEKCLQHLPLLQVAKINEIPHNATLQPAKPLALTDLWMRAGLNEWSPDLLPHVTHLKLQGPLRNVKTIFNFPNLTVLKLKRVSGEDVMEILRTPLRNLEYLKLKECAAEPYELFCLCQKLERLDWRGTIIEGGEPDLHPVTAINFRRLRSVRLELERLPSTLVNEILMAPDVQFIWLDDVDMGTPEEIINSLQRREIMQHLREISLFKIHYNAFQDYVALFEAIIAHAPTLHAINFYVNESQLPSLLNDLEIPGLQVLTMIYDSD